MTIRPITEADYLAVGEVHVRSWRVGYAGIVPDDYLAALDPAVNAERRRDHPRPPGSQTLVAENADETIVGFASFGPDREDQQSGEIYAIYVRPDHWRHGAGRHLFTAAMAHLRESGYRQMRLWVLTENARARQFYERMEMAPDGATDTYTPNGTETQLPELRYTRPL
ncbi:GNAT family N-acetyltransferase [Actinoplanes sp. NPDC026619]|uniref:GNAT family N-acetyltransferase n=1 Tax=Actinoplanes sp. NPDC026619 TaxID=3155798 RepID=UPI0033D0C132